jgi:hypothetical protein
MASDVLMALSSQGAPGSAKPRNDSVLAWFELLVSEARAATRRFRSELMDKEAALEVAADTARSDGAQHKVRPAYVFRLRYRVSHVYNYSPRIQARLGAAERRSAELAAEAEELRGLKEEADAARRAAEQRLLFAERRISQLEGEVHACAGAQRLAANAVALREAADARLAAAERRIAELEPECRSMSGAAARLNTAERRQQQQAELRVAELEAELQQCRASAMSSELASEKERLALQRQLLDARASKEAAETRLLELERDTANFTHTMDSTLQRLSTFQEEVGSFHSEQLRGSAASSPNLLRMSQLRGRAEFLSSEMLLSRIRQLQHERDHLARQVAEQSAVCHTHLPSVNANTELAAPSICPSSQS